MWSRVGQQPWDQSWDKLKTEKKNGCVKIEGWMRIPALRWSRKGEMWHKEERNNTEQQEGVKHWCCVHDVADEEPKMTDGNCILPHYFAFCLLIGCLDCYLMPYLQTSLGFYCLLAIEQWSDGRYTGKHLRNMDNWLDHCEDCDVTRAW